jgi:hypothetical protein
MIRLIRNGRSDQAEGRSPAERLDLRSDCMESETTQKSKGREKISIRGIKWTSREAEGKGQRNRESKPEV